MPNRYYCKGKISDWLAQGSNLYNENSSIQVCKLQRVTFNEYCLHYFDAISYDIVEPETGLSEAVFIYLLKQTYDLMKAYIGCQSCWTS